MQSFNSNFLSRWHFKTLLLLIFNFFSAYSQQYNFENYSVDNGYPATVFTMYQDSRGFIWLGTDGQGVCCMDGSRKIYYTKTEGLAGNTVRDILEDKFNRLWFATDEGISVYDGLKFIKLSEEEGLSSNIVMCLYQTKNSNILAGTAGDKGGLNNISINKDSFKIEIISRENGLNVSSIFSIYQDQWDRIWIGTFGGGVNVFSHDFKPLKYFTTIEGFPSNYILKFSPENSQNLWISSYDKAGFKIILNKNIERCKIIPPYILEGGSISTTWDIIVDQKSVWQGTNMSGLFRIQPKSVLKIDENNGLVKNQIIELFKDRENELWVSCYDGGISRFLGEEFIHFTKEDLPLFENITSIKKDESGKIWLGTFSNGLFFIENPQKGLFPQYIGLKNVPIFSIDIDIENNVWIGTNEGLYRYKKGILKNFNKKNSGIINDNINTVFIDKKNHIWCGTPKGISFYDGKKFKNSIEEYLPNTEIQTIIGDQLSNKWCGSLGGLIKFHGDSITTFDDQEGLFHKKIHSLSVDSKNNLWIGTFGGGIYFLKAGLKKDTIIHLKTNTLTSLNIYFLQLLNDSNLLIGTDKGLNRWLLNKDGSVKASFTYAYKDGFTGVKCNLNASIKLKNSVLICTSKGLTVYNFTLDKINQSIPRININSLKLFFKDIDWQKAGFKTHPWNKLPENLILKHSQNHLSFEFSGILFSDKEEIQYRYKLEGFDEVWSPFNKKTEATYTSLPAGKYTFKVTASNRYGQWNQEPASFSFEIKPPFWRTYWFYFGVTFLLVIIFFSYIKYRERQLRKEKEALESIVKERTQEVVAQKQEIESQHKILSNQQKEITASINYAKKLQSAVMPPNDVFSNIFSDNFILYKPKDIVSGDFYWYGIQNNKIIVIAADCTGHGVPGAFTSMLGISLLNKIIAESETTSPDDILNKMRANIINSLKQKEDNELQDGMDMVILTFEKDLSSLEFCGANNSMFLVSSIENLENEEDCSVVKNDKNFLREIKGNKMPVSIYPIMNSFKKQEIKLFHGDMIYIFSDGYMDQIGGPNKKKFMNKQFKHLILEIAHLPMDEQKNILDQRLLDWMNFDLHSQLDDVLVIGMKCN